MASWEVVSPHISSSMEQNSSSSSNGNNRPKVGFHISDLHAANEGEGGGTKKSALIFKDIQIYGNLTITCVSQPTCLVCAFISFSLY